MKLLFIEDNLRFVKVALTQFLADYQVTQVSSVAAALEILQGQKFDILLIDFDLSDGKGSVVAEIASKLVPKPFLIAISSHEAGNAALIEAGADIICSKMQFSSLPNGLKTRLEAPL